MPQKLLGDLVKKSLGCPLQLCHIILDEFLVAMQLMGDIVVLVERKLVPVGGYGNPDVHE